MKEANNFIREFQVDEEQVYYDTPTTEAKKL